MYFIFSSTHSVTTRYKSASGASKCAEGYYFYRLAKCKCLYVAQKLRQPPDDSVATIDLIILWA